MIVQTNKGKFKITTIEDEKGYLAVATSLDDNRYFFTFNINSLVEEIVKQINEA